MTPEQYVASLRNDSAAFATAARLGLEPDVAACPGWNVAALTDHLGGVDAFWRTTLVSGAMEPPEEPDTPGPEHVDVDWFEGQAALLATALEAADPGKPMWNWTGANQTVGWLLRRMAQESAVHRWDAQAAHGVAEPIDEAVAADGIAELFDTFLPAALTYGAPPEGTPQATVVVTAPDGPPWTLRLGPGVLAAEPAQAADADLTIAGPASDLLLLLWNRRDLEGLDVQGDPAALAGWRALPMF